MTDKIVQLVDKDNNNIYPVTTADAPTITVTSVDPGEGVSLAANHFIAVYGNDQDSYSTNEMETNAKWIDGKTIYKKTIDFGYLPNNDSKSVSHGIANLDKVIKVEETIDNGTSYPHGFVLISSAPASATGWNLYGNDTQITISTSADRSTVYAYITLYYTKSA